MTTEQKGAVRRLRSAHARASRAIELVGVFDARRYTDYDLYRRAVYLAHRMWGRYLEMSWGSIRIFGSVRAMDAAVFPELPPDYPPEYFDNMAGAGARSADESKADMMGSGGANDLRVHSSPVYPGA